MYHNLQIQHAKATPVPDHDRALVLLQTLFEHRRGAFLNAASLLAGSRGVAIVNAIVENLQRGSVGRGTRSALRRLLAILSLDDVDTASEYFLGIEPADPRVDAICILTDELRDTLQAALVPEMNAATSVTA